MKNEWDEYAKNWDSDASVAEYAHNAYAGLNKMIDIEGLCVLDFGCGTGALTKIISAKASRIVAIDPSTEMISYLDKKAINNVKTIADFLSLELISSLKL